ncbi:hypothetical protein BE08_05525, partial [Sorangium cellulosum]
MDVYCEVCGIVTTVSSDARGGSALECWVCGGAMFRAQGRGAAAAPGAARVEERSSRPPPPLRRSSAPSVLRDDDDPTMMDLRAIALKSF